MNCFRGFWRIAKKIKSLGTRNKKKLLFQFWVFQINLKNLLFLFSFFLVLILLVFVLLLPLTSTGNVLAGFNFTTSDSLTKPGTLFCCNFLTGGRWDVQARQRQGWGRWNLFEVWSVKRYQKSDWQLSRKIVLKPTFSWCRRWRRRRQRRQPQRQRQRRVVVKKVDKTFREESCFAGISLESKFRQTARRQFRALHSMWFE